MLNSYKEKFVYTNYVINNIEGIRFYNISDNLNVPSVTSILKFTKNPDLMNSTDNRISDAMEIGNMMHMYLDHYVSKEDEYIPENKNFLIAKKLAQTVIDNCIMSLGEIWGTETSIHYKNQYAGTIDLIGIHDDKLTIIDYKSSYRKKTDEEMQEYFLQLAAYAIAHDWQHGTSIESCLVFLSLRNGDFVKTIVSSDGLKNLKNLWFERLDLFNKEYYKNV